MSRFLSFLSLVFIVFLSIVFYASTVRGVKGNVDHNSGKKLTSVGMPFESSHERAPYALVLAIDKYRQINLTEQLAEFGSPDVGTTQGKFFILFPPGVSFLIYPFYEYGKNFNLAQLFSYGSISLYAIGSVILLYLLSRQMFHLPIWVSSIVPLIWAFASTSWSYAITIYQHVPVTFFLLLMFYSVFKFRNKGMFSFFWASLVWISYGVGLFIDFPSLFLGFPILIYFFVSTFSLEQKEGNTLFSVRPLAVISSIWFIVLIGLHGYYNHLAFGDWKKFGQSFTRYEGKEKYEARLERQKAEATMSAQLKPIASIGSNPFNVFDEDRIINGTYTLTLADDKGIFYYSPVFILGIIAWFFYYKERQLEKNILISLTLVNLVLYAMFGDPWGGWAYGPRYLIPAMAYLSIFVGIFLYRFFLPWIGRLLFIPLFIFSTAISILGVLTTNIVPPKIEGIPLQLQYNYIANIFYLFDGVTGSFVYREFLFEQISLSQFAAILFFILCTVMFLYMFIGLFQKPFHKHRFPEIMYMRKGFAHIGKLLHIRL